jgi:Fe-S cluster assembly protein SufD
MAPVAERQDYVSRFDAFTREPAFGPAWLSGMRKAAFERFRASGFPTTRDEEWRFTNVTPIADTEFATPSNATASLAPGALAPFVFDKAVAAQVTVVNGRVTEIGSLPKGVTVTTLGETVKDAALTPIGSIAQAGMPFVSLNTAFFDDAVVLRIAPKAVVAEPIHVVFVTVASDAAIMASPRLIVQAGEASEVQIVESYVSVAGRQTFTNAVSEFILDERAIVDHVKIQRESTTAFHIAATFISSGRSATFSSQSISLGGRIVRNDITSVLAGEGAECTLNGLYIAQGDSVIDNHTTIDHAKAHCPSHEVYKGILGGHAKAVFNGKIIVRPDAQKTDAKQTNKALLLSDDASINTKPQLEIFADDVKCTHGAAIGQLDEDAMFYLRARGIAFVDARNIMIHAFAGQVLDQIKIVAVRERVERVMSEQLELAGNFSLAAG